MDQVQIRALDRHEVHALRTCAEFPIQQAPDEARCAALAAGFVEDIVNPSWRDNAGFQVACICALQNGKLEGEDFPSALTKVPIKNGRGKYDLFFTRGLKNYLRLDVWVNDLAHAAKGLIRDGHTLDILRLYSDVMDRYDADDRGDPWNSPASVKRWTKLIGDYQIRCDLNQ